MTSKKTDLLAQPEEKAEAHNLDDAKTQVRVRKLKPYSKPNLTEIGTLQYNTEIGGPSVTVD